MVVFDGCSGGCWLRMIQRPPQPLGAWNFSSGAWCICIREFMVRAHSRIDHRAAVGVPKNWEGGLFC